MTEFSILYRKYSKHKKSFEISRSLILCLKKYDLNLIFNIKEDGIKCLPAKTYKEGSIFLIDDKGRCEIDNRSENFKYPVLKRRKTEYPLDKETEIKSGDVIEIDEHEFWIV